MSDVKQVASSGAVQRQEVDLSNINDVNDYVGMEVLDNGGDGGENTESEEEKSTRLGLESDKTFKGLTPEEQKAKISEKIAGDKANAIPELNEVQRTALLKQLLGDDFDGNIEAVKDKLKKPQAEITEEQRVEADKAFQKRMLDVYIEAGGDINNFAALQNVAVMDLTQLSISEIKREFKDAGFGENEIDAVIKEGYFQLNPEELEQGEDENDSDFEERKKAVEKKAAFGKSKIEAKGKSIQDKAKGTLQQLRTSIEQFDLQQRDMEKTEADISSKTDEIVSSYPKTINLDLGKKADDSAIDLIPYKVDEAHLKKVQGIMKDATQRNNILYNNDGSLNVESITKLLLENEVYKDALKVSYLEADSRATAHFRTIFPNNSAASLGLQGSRQPVNTGKEKPKQPASFGKAVRAGQPA